MKWPKGGTGIGAIDTASAQTQEVNAVNGSTGPCNLYLSLGKSKAFVRGIVASVAVVILKLATVDAVVKVGNGHGGIEVPSNGRNAITTAIADEYISAVDTKSLKMVEQIKVGKALTASAQAMIVVGYLSPCQKVIN